MIDYMSKSIQTRTTIFYGQTELLSHCNGYYISKMDFSCCILILMAVPLTFKQNNICWGVRLWLNLIPVSSKFLLMWDEVLASWGKRPGHASPLTELLITPTIISHHIITHVDRPGPTQMMHGTHFYIQIQCQGQTDGCVPVAKMLLITRWGKRRRTMGSAGGINV